MDPPKIEAINSAAILHQALINNMQLTKLHSPGLHILTAPAKTALQ